jgi:peptidoglycan/xylan/chitin deacetylase (PgdA/CDA1 family)
VIASISRTLAAHHVPPTYGFTNGVKLREHPEDAAALRAWVGAGHLLGNHGFSHMNLDDRTILEAYLKDIDDNEETLRAYSPPNTPERSWKVYRYPFLQQGMSEAASRAVRDHLARGGYRVAQVSIDFGDWAWNPAHARCASQRNDPALQALDRSFRQESTTFLRWSVAASWQALHRDVPQVALLHVGAGTARALDGMLTAYEKASVVFVSLDAALDDPAYAMETGYHGKWGESFFEQLADGLGTVNLPRPLMPLALLDGICRP